MTHDRIFELAIAAELIDHRDTDESLPPDFVASLKEFATLVRAEVLEESAGVCDERSLADFPQTQTGMGFSFSQQWDAARTAEKQCAAAIRNLKADHA